jgi:hypothetical protein
LDLADKRPLCLAWTVRRMGKSQGKLTLPVGGNELTVSSLSSSTSGLLYSVSTS